MDRSTKLAIVVSTVVVLILAVFFGKSLIDKLTPNKEYMELSEYYTIPEGEAMLILDDFVYEKNAKFIDGAVYVELDLVKTLFNHRFYWDDIENYLIYTTPTELVRTELGSRDYYINKTKNTLEHSIIKTIGEQVFVLLKYVEMYSDFTFQVYDSPARAVLEYKPGEYLFVEAAKDGQLRSGGSIKDFILRDVKAQDKLMVIDNGGSEGNGFIKVMTMDGVRGYISEKQVNEPYYESRSSKKSFPEYTSLKTEEKINLVWHQVTNMEANDSISSLLEKAKSVTTVSPTWFRVDSVEGTLRSLLSENYIEKMHGLGLEVWALVDNFEESVNSHELLSKTSNREKLVNEITAQAIKYNLDGINIDFENLSQETGPHYVQFLRELSVKCRTNQLVLSVDNYIPASYNRFYDLTEQGKIVDYVVIMGYDEHHTASEQAGSVSSITFFGDAIKNTMEMVPEDKIIMAVPFYTRLWKEYVELGENRLSTEALGMSAAENTVEKAGVTPEWDETTGQYYAEFEKGGATYKIWLEEEDSLDAKLKLIFGANLKGVASWRLGFEKSSIWNVFLKYLN